MKTQGIRPQNAGLIFFHPRSSSRVIPLLEQGKEYRSEDNFKFRSFSIYWPEGGVSFDRSSRSVQVKILFNILARGGGSFDPAKILFNIFAARVAVLIPHEHNLKFRSGSIYWPEGVAVLSFDLLCTCRCCFEGVAVLIPHEDQLKVRSCSIYWPDRVAVLIPHGDKFKLRSDSIHWPGRVAVLIPH